MGVEGWKSIEQIGKRSIEKRMSRNKYWNDFSFTSFHFDILPTILPVVNEV